MTDKIRRGWPPPARCGALAQHSGEPCRRWAIPGGSRCKHHGGLGGRNGRAAAEDRLAMLRLEALATAAAARIMAADGVPADIIEAAGGPLVPRTRGANDLDEAEILGTSANRMAEKILARFRATAIAHAAPEPVTVIDGLVLPDPVSERVEQLERRPTSRRMLEAAELRAAHERPVTPEPESEPEEPGDDWVDELVGWIGAPDAA